MKPKSQERGQALILIVFAAVGLFAFAALAIDGSRVFSDRRHAQNAADTSVLAAALAKIRGEPYVEAGEKRANSNGFNDTNSVIDVSTCDLVNPPCEGLPTGALPAEYIQVRIELTTQTTFARILGRDSVKSVVTAVARVQGSSSTSSSPLPAIVGLRQTGCAICAGGTVVLDVNGSGVQSNSSGSACTPPQSASIDFSGTGTYSADGGFTMPSGGILCAGFTASVTGAQQVGAQVSPNYNIPAPTITCSGDVFPATGATVFTPGHYPDKLTISSSATFSPGNYCFDDGLFINANANVTANDVNFRIDGGDFQTHGASNATFTCSNALIYVTGGGTGVHFNGNGTNNCTGVTFYMESGDVTWNGNVAQILKAPTDPNNPYKGLLIYVPESNGSQLNIAGTSGSDLTGSIIAPGSEIKISGVSGSSGYNTQIIGAFITLDGASNTVINYDQSAQYDPPASPVIQLTK